MLGDVNAHGLTECPGNKMRVSTAETMIVIMQMLWASDEDMTPWRYSTAIDGAPHVRSI